LRWLAVLLLALAPATARAVARPHHTHDDLFDESDLQIGVLGGPQITGFTAIQQGNTVISVSSSMRFVTGASFKFIYNYPRVEFDVLWNARGWINTADTVNSLSLPVMLKLPWEIDKGMDIEFMGGFQPDHVIFGADPHNEWLYGVLAGIGLTVDFTKYLFNFELRYDWGTSNVSDQLNGARNRDFMMIGGIAWHF
jgi:hypothetical protein